MKLSHPRLVSWNLTWTSAIFRSSSHFAFGVHPLGCLARPNTLKGGHLTFLETALQNGARTPSSARFFPNRLEHTDEGVRAPFRNRPWLLALAAIAGLSIGPARASNLLVNPSFEQNSGNSVPTGRTFFEPPTSSRHDYWIVDTNSVNCNHFPPQSGTLYWKQWNALYAPAPTNNVAGIYQTLRSSPGSAYLANGWMATCSGDQLGADGFTWLQVEFLNSSSNVIRLYKSDNFSASVGADAWFQYQVTNACDLSQPVSTGDPYFTTYAVTGSVSQLTAPSGTAFVRFRYCFLQANSEGGSAFVDNTALNQVSGNVPPLISNLFPQDTMIFVNPSSGISFNASSPSGFTINSSGIHLTLNGTDVSGSLLISGSASSKNVTYSGLQSNAAYTASISVTDVSNLTVSASIQFQTMWLGVLPPTYLWEAEDWGFT